MWYLPNLKPKQRAPSSFNAQPYRCIIVDDADVKAQLADAMLGRNAMAVTSAPVTAVFLADLSRQLCSSLCDHFGCCIAASNLIPHHLTSTSFTPEPMRRIDDLVALERDNGVATPVYLKALPTNLSTFAGCGSETLQLAKRVALGAPAVHAMHSHAPPRLTTAPPL